jgi:hypothetical protein
MQWNNNKLNKRMIKRKKEEKEKVQKIKKIANNLKKKKIKAKIIFNKNRRLVLLILS